MGRVSVRKDRWQGWALLSAHGEVECAVRRHFGGCMGHQCQPGGGYSVRLCPSNSDLSEECFQRTVLRAASNVSWIQDGSDKSSRREISALRTSVGTYPVGAEWTRNPIPD